VIIGAIERNVEVDEDRGETAPDREPSAEALEKRAAERLEEIHQYLRDRYARRETVTSTETPAGQVLDWIPRESQVREAKIADPPAEDRPVTFQDGEQRAEPVVFELQRRDAKIGPPGTVPVVRKDIERIRPIVGLQDWLAKGTRAKLVGPPDDARGIEAPGSGATHKYGYTSQSVICYGTEGNINAWDPYVEWSDEFSLGQLWLTRGSGSGLQTLEVGHQEYRDLYGDWVPHLFVYYTTNGYTASGDNKGGYNQDVDGWVQVSNTIYPEALSSPLSVFGGTQYNMALKVQLYQGNWWVRVNGTWIGYYPASLYSISGLRSQADMVAWGGEVVDSDDHAGTTATDMGNGHWPYEGWQKCAYMTNLLYQSATSGTMARYDATTWASHPKCYGVEGHFNNTGSWGSYFWWGGSGKNSQCP
jgi:Neprosin